MPKEPDADALKEVLDHAWGWFSLHAGQRMQLFNFFFAVTAVLATAYATAFGKADYGVAAVIGAGGVLLSVAFWRLDIRTAYLAHAGEDALRCAQEALAARAGITEVCLVDRVEQPHKRITSYSHVMRTVHALAALAFVAGAVTAVWYGVT
jgi:hypothetical protein